VSIDAKSRDILVDAQRLKQSVFVTGEALPITFQTFILAVEEHHLLLDNRIRPRFINRFAASKSFSLLAGMVRFQADHVSSDGEHIVFPLKEDSVIEETRQAERFSFTADERVISEILNPFDGETRLSKSVMDMSATGLSLRTTFESKLFQADTYLPSIRVLIDGELYKQGPGRVVYRRKLMDLNGQMRTQVGIKFES
jgi:hypothetical protein